MSSLPTDLRLSSLSTATFARHLRGHLSAALNDMPAAHLSFFKAALFISDFILHSLICRVLLLLLLLLLRHASDLRNCTSYFGACMWVWYCRSPIGAHFHPTPQPPPVPQQLGETPKNWALNRQFPAKMMKHETPSISESTKPIEMKI